MTVDSSTDSDSTSATTTETNTPSLNRLAYLGGVAVGLAGSLAGCTDDESGSTGGSVPSLGGGNLPAAGGVGSGFAYEQPDVTQAQATHTARTADQLIQIAAQSSRNAHPVVWIPPDAAIDLTGYPTINLDNITLASSRMKDKHPGAIIYTNTVGEGTAQYDGGGMFDCGENVRITGLRLRGPHSNVYDDPRFPGYMPQPSGSRAERYNWYDANASRGLTVSHGSVRIDNCEIFGWSRMGVYVNCPRSYGRSQEQSYPRFNNISGHDCMMTSSGYVFEIIRGHAIIERSFFNATRHAVAGFGHPDSGYTISECYFGPAQALFPVDQHYMGENNGNASDPRAYKYRYHAGGMHRILNCSFTATHVIKAANFSGGSKTPHIVIGAIPHKGCVVKGNAFAHSSMKEAIAQPRTPRGTPGPNGYVNFEISDNTYGVDFGFDYGQG